MVIKDYRTELQNKTIINKMIRILKSVWNYVNVFDIPQLARDISCDVKHIRKCYDDSQKAIENYKVELAKEREDRIKEQNLFVSVMDHIEDMLWSKDIDGRYVVANKAFRNKFCYGLSWNDIQGKNDIELAKIFKEKVGAENHTFGEKCRNSDKVVLDTRRAERFLESGKVQGKMLYLEVFKAPWYVNGELKGVVGTGRDMTAYVEAYREQNCRSCGKMSDIFKKYEYGG